MSVALQVVFFVAAAVAVVAAIGLVLNFRPQSRPLLLVLLGLGLGGMYAALSAGMAALLALACYLGIAASVRAWPRPGDQAHADHPPGLLRQLAGPAAGWVLIVVVFVVVRIPLAVGHYVGGYFGSVTLARSLFAHDVLPGLAVAALLMSGCTAAVVTRRARKDRG